MGISKPSQGLAKHQKDMAVLSFMLERQAEGIALAKQRGSYKGRKPTAMLKRNQVMPMLEEGLPKAEIAERTGISLSSVQRIARTK
ncbi:helix-turn-helix domain-containing protein [Shewanella algae]|uniref:helix-turn-helix domain-containing protein n=1 Tax=Shewanella algae TaxID=38313 RepID=UPI0031F5C260